MLDSIAHIAEALRKARKNKRLSQRALSVRTGLTQSHISKIENGEINLQLTSLLEMSRVLDFELMLIPRQQVPAINSLLQYEEKKQHKQIPAYRLDDTEDSDD